MSSFSRLNHRLTHNHFLAGLVIFLISLIIFSYLQFYNGITDPDAFYHVKITQLMSQQGVVTDFPWMQFSTWKDGFVDHHFLYHFLMIPFVHFFPPLIGGKIFQVLLCSLALLAFFWLLKELKIRAAFWFSLLLFLAPIFLFRVDLVKAQPLSLIILFIGLAFIVKRKYFLLFLASFVYVLSYGGWILLPLCAVLMAAVQSLDSAGEKITWQKGRRWQSGRKFLSLSVRMFFSRKNLALMFSSGLGALAGLIINPYFPQNINFYWVHIVQIGLVNYQGKFSVGAEWYPYSFFELLQRAWLILALCLIAVPVWLNYFKKATMESKFFGLLFVLILLLTFKSKRNIEYLIPLGIIFAAAAINVFSQPGRPADDFLRIKKFLAKLVPPSGWPKKMFFASLLIIIAVSFASSLKYSKWMIQASGFNYAYLKGAADFIKSHSRPGEIVFNGNWSDFPALFYHNDSNYYIIGLDPTFMYLYDSGLQRKMIDITRGKRYEEAYEIIKNELRASYIQATAKDQKFKSILDNNFKFKKVYEDSDGAVYEVL